LALALQSAGAMARPYSIQDRSFLFATEIVSFCKPVMPPGAVVRELAHQLIRSGTSIGANLQEADAAESKPDFRTKVAISRKEARETAYWLRLIAHADPRLTTAAHPLLDEAQQLVNILTTIKMNSERNDRRGDAPDAK
jgi:four helix bundle protein